jgi:hypothetical protein
VPTKKVATVWLLVRRSWHPHKYSMMKTQLPTTAEISEAFEEIWSGSSDQAPVTNRVVPLTREDLDTVAVARELDAIFDRAVAEAIEAGVIIMRDGQLHRTLKSLDDAAFPSKRLN